jgi:DNA gyrase subunit A
MSDAAKEITPITIEQELKQSYLDYAMSVIVGRALPDVRDGLKPVHRRVLYAMHELNNDWNKPHKKSARVVGDVIGKYHPHGDTAVYDAIVRMAQPFSMRYMLIDGQGNFGSVDGDAPAAMRYTEIRMARITHALLADLDKETVDFVPNYDETETAPSVLPTQVPNLLINGSSGIAVGMATNIPPHNLGEVVQACIALVDNPELSLEELMQYIPGPDFPTAGIINGRAGILQAYRTGRGKIYLRARTEVEENEKSNKQAIIIKELPYQVNKARLLEKIAELVKHKKVEGISGLRDESDKDGMRVVIELRRGENADVVLNNLYAHTAMQTVFGINMVALVDNVPGTLSLKQVLEAFIKHRREVITRRSIYELRKARARAHILEGLGIALANIEPMIQLIKQSSTPAIAKEKLIAQTWPAGMVAQMLAQAGTELSRPEDLAAQYGLQEAGYQLSPEQAQAILELRLHRLTGLEQDKIIGEYKQLIEEIQRLINILSIPEELLAVMKAELTAIHEQFADARRTEIIESQQDLCIEDLITEENMVVTLSHEGYVKAQPLDQYQAQRRGGKGKAATAVKEEDFVRTMLIASSHDTILCFSSLGKLYWLKTYQLPQASRTSRGRPIINLLALQAGEYVTTILPVQDFAEDKYVFMATSKGLVKKVSLSQFSRPRANGIIAIKLNEEDQLIGAEITSGSSDILLCSSAGKAIRFSETAVRAMGRVAAGVIGMRLDKAHKVISLMAAKPGGSILTATENGYGKRTPLEEYRVSGRGGQGVISIQVSERNGAVVSALQVFPELEVMLISDAGTMVRTRVAEISKVGRNAQGVRLINLGQGEKLVTVQRIDEDEIQGEAE